jgi:hypothetical protein
MVKAPRVLLRGLRAADAYLGRRHDRRRLLVDARTPVNYTMVAPVVRALEADSRIEFYFTASEEPHRMRSIYREAPHVRLVHPRVAAFMKFDGYIASDFMWATLPLGTRRIYAAFALVAFLISPLSAAPLQKAAAEAKELEERYPVHIERIDVEGVRAPYVRPGPPATAEQRFAERLNEGSPELISGKSYDGYYYDGTMFWGSDPLSFAWKNLSHWLKR